MNSKSMASNLPSDLARKASDLQHPVRSLSVAFWLWKALLFIVVVACPGPGYDTSTTLLSTYARPIATTSSIASWSSALLQKFVRWDSLYFLHVSQKGYVFEQEWAFGYGYTKLLSFLASGISWFPPFFLTIAHADDEHDSSKSNRSTTRCVNGSNCWDYSLPYYPLFISHCTLWTLCKCVWCRDFHQEGDVFFVCCPSRYQSCRCISLCTLWGTVVFLSQSIWFLHLFVLALGPLQ